MKVGFSGGLVVDFPHSTRAKKYYLVLLVSREAWRGGATQGRSGCALPLERICPAVQSQFPHTPPPSCVQVGGHAALPAPRGMDGEDPSDDEDAHGVVQVGQRRTKRRKGGVQGRGVEWIVKKKAQQRGRGHENIKPDTKYTGRKRKVRF